MSALGHKRTFAVHKRMSALCQKQTWNHMTFLWRGLHPNIGLSIKWTRLYGRGIDLQE